ncbi:MAG: HAD-IB family phosphatase [Desulfosalsimonas sp.]
MTEAEKKNPAVFCDFDGTITARESLEAVLTKFVPGRWQDMKQQLISGEVSLRTGVRRMIESISSDRYSEVMEFVRQIPLRPGLEEFLDFLGTRGIPFVIVSGGLRAMVEAGLGSLIEKVHAVFAADVKTGGPYLRVVSEYEAGDELVAKAGIIRGFDAEPRIVIGDGMTDFNMAETADLVFARDSLADYLEKTGISYIKWDDFFRIRHELAERIEKGLI